MELEPVVIEGVTHPVTVTRNRFGGDVRLLVEGRPVAQGGAWAREYQLPLTSGGTATAVVHSGLVDPYPSIEVDGKRYRTGPRPSTVLRILALVPGLAVLAGFFGVLIGVPAFVANLALVRSALPAKTKALAIAAIDVAAIVLTAVLYRATTGSA